MTTKLEDTANIGASLPSRRAMIGSLAALPVASVPAIAGVAAMDDPDPIFVLIEAWKRANAKDDEAYEIYKRLSDEVGPWDGVSITFGDLPKSLGEYQTHSRADLEKWIDLCRRLLQLRGSSASFEEEQDRVLAKFNEAKRAYDEKREASGLNAAVGLHEELADARRDAEDAVMQAQPRTHASVVALLVFAAEYWQRHDVENYPDIPAAMVTAARAIAGDPSKIFISERLAESLEGWLKPWQENRT
jgi:hypothetical protein